jgi:hypothetical protein
MSPVYGAVESDVDPQPLVDQSDPLARGLAV